MHGQNITRFIEVTGAANVGWTEAGLIEGNDFHNGGTSYALYARPVRHPVRMDRFYVPVWVEEARQMYAALDETIARVEAEYVEDRELDKMLDDARQVLLDNQVPLEVFELEWVVDGDERPR